MIGRQIEISGTADDAEVSADGTSIGIDVVAAGDLGFAVLAVLLASPSNFEIMDFLDGRT